MCIRDRFNPERPAYSVGLIVYIALIIVFAYFYTSITFNPLEVANNMKKSGGFIPGIRPGKPTSDYLDGILEYIILIGACGLIIVCLVPVSYTHLDVYKRQLLNRALLSVKAAQRSRRQKLRFRN